jgi:hypothetical protein
MNIYRKYCPNVFVAQCTDKYEKGDIILIETKYGKEVENEVHNLLGTTKEGQYLYSVTRTDGTNSQTRAAAKADKLEGYAANAEKKSTAYYEASQEGRDFLILGEPIKVGHHSERRHRKLIERNWQRMGKSVAESDKAKEYERRAEYWVDKASKIDLSMPDSLEYFEFKLEEAKKKHQFLKDNPDKRPHSMSLQYSNKEVKDLQDKVETAIRLWGDEEEIALLNQEKKATAESKVPKKKADIVERHNGFFAFNQEQFREGYENLKSNGLVDDGEKVVHVGMGLYIPKSNVSSFIAEYKK